MPGEVVAPLPEFLRIERARSGLTQRKVAQALGCSSQLVSQWETGDGSPTLVHVRKLAELYDGDPGKYERFLLAHIRGGGERTEDPALRMATVLATLLEDVRNKVRDDRVIIHSFSNRSFLTGSSFELGQAVCECAAEGVDIVYFCLPGSVGVRDVKPKETVESLRDGLFGAFHELRRIRPIELQDVARHLWAVEMPEQTDPLDFTGLLLGTFVRLLTIVRAQRPDAANAAASISQHTARGSGSTEDPQQKEWREVIPDSMELEDVWVHLYDSAAGLSRWERVKHDAAQQARYYAILQKAFVAGGATLSQILEGTLTSMSSPLSYRTDSLRASR